MFRFRIPGELSDVLVTDFKFVMDSSTGEPRNSLVIRDQALLAAAAQGGLIVEMSVTDGITERTLLICVPIKLNGILTGPAWDFSSWHLFGLPGLPLNKSATVPGAILGTLATAYVKRGTFDALLGVVLILASIFIFVRPNPISRPRKKASPNSFRRVLVDSEGETHDFSYNLPLGLALSLIIGFLSSLLGIGGGIIHVPVLILLLSFPVHIATATSHFMLAIMALTATLMHVGTGGFAHGGIQRTIVLSVGMIMGAQLGAILSPRLQGGYIVRGLAIALAMVGMRLLWVASQAAQVAKV